jgi:hypothetical protein
MRLPGTLAWAKKDCRQDEMTELKQPKGRRQRFNAAELTKIPSIAADKVEETCAGTEVEVYGTGTLKLWEGVDIVGRSIKMLDGDNWHTNMNEAVASMVSRGIDDDIIQAVFVGKTLDGYTQADTLKEVRQSIFGARKKGFNNREREATGFITLDEALDLPPPSFLIDGMLVDKGVGFLAGKTQSLKSFVATHMALCIANGHPLGHRKVKQGNVLYAALEGFPGVAWRYNAAQRYHKLTAPIEFERSIDLKDPYKVDALIERAMGIEDLKLVVIDTFRKAASGADENSSKEMEVAIKNAYDIANAVDGMVLLIHHMGKDESRGMRGSSSLSGDVDNIMTVKRPGKGMNVEVTVDKVKDGEDGFKVMFKAQKHDAIHPRTGELRETLIVLPSGVGDMSAPDLVKMVLADGDGLTREEIRQSVSLIMSLEQKDIRVPVESLDKAVTRLVTSGKATKDAESRHFLTIDDDG